MLTAAWPTCRICATTMSGSESVTFTSRYEVPLCSTRACMNAKLSQWNCIHTSMSAAHLVPNAPT
jgi:hypothetical protein